VIKRSIVASALVLVLAASASSAAAAPADDGLWYFDAANIAAQHDAGITGKGVTIAVLDGPVNTDIPTLKDANIEVREPSFCYTDDHKLAPATSTDLSGPDSAYHGTNVVSYIAGTGDGYEGQTGVKGVAPGAKVLYYAVSRLDKVVAGGEQISCLEKDGTTKSDEVGQAMTEAMDAGADIIVIAAGYNGDALSFGNGAYERAIREGVIVVGSVANTDDLVVSMNFPAGANGSVGVQAADINGTIQTTDGRPNDNPSTMVIAPGIGILGQGERDGTWEKQIVIPGSTSVATPIAAGYIALAMQKWPDATGNQILQDMVRSSNDAGTASFDPSGLVGYGFVTATRMIQRDPSQYEDVNPLLENVRGFAVPTSEEIYAAPTATPEPDPNTAAPAPSDAAPIGLLVALVVGGLVVLGVIILVVVLAVRRSRPRVPGTKI